MIPAAETHRRAWCGQFWHDARRPNAYLMLVLAVALALKNDFVWTGRDADAELVRSHLRSSWRGATPTPRTAPAPQVLHRLIVSGFIARRFLCHGRDPPAAPFTTPNVRCHGRSAQLGTRPREVACRRRRVR